MTLIVITGLPASGKSTRARQLRDYFLSTRHKTATILSEDEEVPKKFTAKNAHFSSAASEKAMRMHLKAVVLNAQKFRDVVILDSGNYIKGFRYELYCGNKAAQMNQCTVYCGIPREQAQRLNAQRTAADAVPSQQAVNSGEAGSDVVHSNGDVPYTPEVFAALCDRYEEPNASCRWDAPLFVVLPGDELDMEAIYRALFESKTPKSNKSTITAPLSATTYLHKLDTCTQDIVRTIVTARQAGNTGDVTIASGTAAGLCCSVPADITASELNRLRRQFHSYNKVQLNGGTDLAAVSPLFVQFLNSTFNK